MIHSKKERRGCAVLLFCVLIFAAVSGVFAQTETTYGDTTAVAVGSFTWRGTTFHEVPDTVPTYTFVGGNALGGDSIVRLHLTLLHATISGNEICEGETTELVISVETPEYGHDPETETKVGDVLCLKPTETTLTTR